MRAQAETQRDIVWSWQGRSVPVGVTTRGTGPTALLLPALSSISTRDEMASLAARLAPRFTTIAVDWPGFGSLPKPAVAWSPAAYRAFLAFLLAEAVPGAGLVVAAGHAAGYLLAEAASRPVAGRRLVLVAPTWRGPLPTMLRRRPPWLARVARAADLPFVGALLYRLNVNPPMVRMMARAHVYADPAWFTPVRAAGKRAVTGAQGARHAAVRFVTGALDPFIARPAALAAAAAVREPVLVLYGRDTPAKSLAEMQALGALPVIETAMLPRGKLSLHEEFPEAVAEAILGFCAAGEAVPPQAT